MAISKALFARIVTAGILLCVFIPALFKAPSLGWSLGTLVLILLALDEWTKLIKLAKPQAILTLLVAGALGLWVSYTAHQNGFHWLFFSSLPIFLVVVLFWVLLAPIALLKRCVPSHPVLMTLLGLLLLGALWLATVCLQWANPWMLLIAMATVWIADSAAFVAGKNFGKHKLAPQISPGKTWEGATGAFLAVSVFAFVLIVMVKVADIWLLPALWLITVLSIVGDLFESLLKRRANMKDSGNLLPGHGGILDRIDALIPTVPLSVLMIYGYHYLQAV